MRASNRIGSSIVHRNAILSETTCIIEQDVSFCVQKRKSGGWTGLVWLDNGKPFGGQLLMPWLDKPRAEYPTHDPYIPIIQHLAKMVLNPPDIEVFESTSQSGPSPESSHKGVHPSQSLNNIAAQYGVSLDRRLMRIDAFYAFSELFKVALCSESQFVNVIQAETTIAAQLFDGQEQVCIDALSYCKAILDEHIDRLRESIALLDAEDGTDWPRANDTDDLAVREATLIIIRKDYKYLLHRCSTLADRSFDGASFIRNHTMTQASERSISQAKEVGRLTLLAYFFLPLSFVTSLFGMNFLEIREWRTAVVSSLCVFIGVMALSLVVCFWDYMPWRRLKKTAPSKPIY